MCSSGGAVAQTDQALMDAQKSMVDTLDSSYKTAFQEQQSVLKGQQARFQQMIASPLGYSAPTLAAARTSANERTATATKQAIGASAAYGASHSSADIVGPGTVGEIASEGEQARAAELTSIDQQNETMKRQSMLTGLEGLNQVGQEFGTAAGTGAGASSSVASSAVNAGTGVEEAKYAGEQAFGSVLSGIGGLAMAGVGAAKLMK